MTAGNGFEMDERWKEESFDRNQNTGAAVECGAMERKICVQQFRIWRTVKVRAEVGKILENYGRQ